MTHTIENKQLICTIDANGAEIRSLKNKVTGKEYIWQIDKSIWGSSSPVLFPAIGKIKDDKIIYQEKEYALPKHGILRNNNELTFEQQSESKCSFSLTSNASNKKQYPFKFLFVVEYTLIEKHLIMNYRIENHGDVPMPFACGGHTAYACPTSDNTPLSDYVIEFPTEQDLQTQTLSTTGLRSPQKRKIESQGNTLPLSDTIFAEDALVFADVTYDWVRLRKKDEDKGIIVKFTGYPHLALWAIPAADYVCIEPWLGLPDADEESTDITQKSTYKTIAPDAIFSIAIETEIE